MPDITLRPPVSASELDAARCLCWDYRTYLLNRDVRERLVVETFYPEDKYRAVMERLAIDHAPPDGLLMLGFVDDQPLACGMFHRIAEDACEWKRVYCDPRARGIGLGRAMCDRLIAESRRAGYRRVLLDTSRTLAPARKLYESLGFVERDAYYDAPEIARDVICFYELML